MSPDRGQEFSPLTMRRTGQRKSKDCADNGFGFSPVINAVVPEEEVPGISDITTSQPPTINHKHSHNNLPDNYDSPMDAQYRGHTAAASVRSMSSTENSRRDSAISASSQQRRRPKPSRTTSKRSVHTVPGDELSQTAPRPNRQRPRNQRFASSGSFHMPQTNIEEALALHARSCELFSGSSRPSTSYAPVPSAYGPYTHPSLHRSLSSADGFPMSHYPSHPTSPYETHAESVGFDVADEEEQYYTTSFPPTVMHWTSDETRLREYAAIDRSNTGVRGLLKKLIPKCVMKSQTKFYDEKDGSDAGSVRRIRLDFPVEKEEPRRTRVPYPLGI